MTDEGRLELDDAGDVVDRSGAPSTLVDLDDPRYTEPLAATALDSWASGSAAPWLRAHPRPIALATSAMLLLALGTAWRASRPAPPPPPSLLTLTDAPVVGADLGGPQISSEGHLSVAYVAHADRSVAQVDVVGIAGPGLTSVGVEAGADTVVGGRQAFVQLGAVVTCDDPAIASATASSYGVVVRTPGSAPGDDRTLGFDGSTTALDIAVRDACLASVLPSRMSVVSGEVTGASGSSVVEVALRFRNDADVPLSVVTDRTPSTTIETDLSPTVTIAPHSSESVPTRMLVHDCGRPSPAPALVEMPGPVLSPGRAVTRLQAGITVRLGLGDRWTKVSYALPWSVPVLAHRLASLACADPPSVSARLVGVAGSRSIDGSWLVTGTYQVRTSGIGIALGREHFTGDAAPGSSLATTDSRVPGILWDLAPTQLDRGSGRLPVTFSGTTCDDRDRGIPTSMAVRVTAADRYVYPFELALDTAGLRRAVDSACAPTSVVSVPGWGEVTPQASPAA